MKVNIDEAGQMNISSETGLEAYALKKWCEDNVSHDDKGTCINNANIIIMCAVTKKEPKI